MKNSLIKKVKGFGKFLCFGLLVFTIQSFLSETSFAQTKLGKTAGKETSNTKTTTDLNLPKVTQLDLPAFKNLLNRDENNSKPLLINFWATWCDPCRAEFPDLVKIDAEFKGKIDFVTVSLDELSEIDRDVPKFLAEMKATMPAYLLKTDNEEDAISTVSKDWSGGLPFTVLLNGKGEIAYSRQGIVKPEILRMELNKIINPQTAQLETSLAEIQHPAAFRQIIELPAYEKFTPEAGKRDALNDVANGKLEIRLSGLILLPKKLKKSMTKYGVKIYSIGCIALRGYADYAKAYNEVSISEIRRRFGDKALRDLGII